VKADPFLRERLSEAVDLEPVDVESRLVAATATGTLGRRHRSAWLLAAAALLTAAAAIGFAAWAFLASRATPVDRPPPPRPTPAPSPTAVRGTGRATTPALAPGLSPAVALSQAPSGVTGSVAFGFGSMWMSVTSPSAVVRVDAKTTVSRTIRVEGAGPIAIGEGAVWTVGDSGVVSRIDPASNRVSRTIRLVRHTTSIAVGKGAVWVLRQDFDSQGRAVVFRIDPTTNSVLKITAPPYADAVAASEDGVWVLIDISVIQRIDPLTNRFVGPVIPIGDRDDVVVGEGAVWVASQSTGELTKLDPASGKVEDTIPLCGENVASGGGCGVGLGDGLVWVLATRSGRMTPRLWSIDPHTDRATQIPVPRVYIAQWAVGGGFFWFTGSGPYLYRSQVPA
jgi:streptogramin lyase